ncbi:MAG: phosphatidylinositol-specific phospholipase C domain-containing protein [Clostridiales bacterium]|nr:phosphatidylinositol-specific phospholipase C domain-containing protein [Clostridiales bacterium]
MKKYLIKGLIVLFLVLASLFAFLPINGINAKKPDLWMARLNDSAKITQLSIPGTHDSGATHSIFDVAGKCQDLSIKEQLAIGVRFLDLRLQMNNDRFDIVHSFVKQNLTFKSVLKDITSFIKQNPSEFIIISIKKEEESVNSSLGFEELLLQELLPYSDIVCLDGALPNTLGEARGKIYILSRYRATVGIPAYSGWKDDGSCVIGNIYVQDNYSVPNAEDKKNSITEAFEFSSNNTDFLTLNFTSCYLDSGFPPTYAGGIAKDINPWLLESLKQGSGSVGVIVADFMTQDLVKAIYGRNF